MATVRRVGDRGKRGAVGKTTRVFTAGGGTRRKGWVLPAVLLATLLVAGTAYAAAPRRLPRRKGMAVDEAVAVAMDRLGASNPHTIAQLACSLAYPDGCGRNETQMVYERVIDALGGGSWADIPPPEGPVSTPLVQQLGGWLNSLTPDQRSGLRDIVGPAYHDPLVAAIAAGDGIALDAEVVRLWELGTNLYEADKFTALMKYGQLQSLLGPRLNEVVTLFV